MKMIILGAGLSGCIASLMIPGVQVYEPFKEVKKHQAILRFKNDLISKALGIPFKKVKVYKGIWHNDHNVQLSPHYISRYSRKVSSKVSHRSICNLDAEERYIAPNNLHEILLEMCKPFFGYDINLINERSTTTISTLPIDILCSHLGIEIPKLEYHSILVSRFTIPDCDAHMTNYYTGASTAVYRASIVGNELIIESSFDILKTDIEQVLTSFGLMGIRATPIIENYEQKYGKLTSIDDNIRKKIIYQLTKEHNIYSLGRFATWRNIQLDDIYNDVLRIKEWANKSDYDRIVS
jgi:hypothetical protein